jgi:HEAT repeat protein
MLGATGVDWYRRRSVLLAIRAMGPAAAEAAPDVISWLAVDDNIGHEVEQTLEAFGARLGPYVGELAAILRGKVVRAYPRVASLLAGLAEHGADVLGHLRQALAAAAKLGEDWPEGYSARQTRTHAAKGLAALGEAAAEAVPDLLPLLDDKDVDVRAEAARALGRARSPTAVGRLSAGLRDGNERVRALSTEALGLIGVPSAASALVPLLRDTSPRVRREAATALGKVGDRSEPVLAALRKAGGDQNKGVRDQAAAALRRLEGRKKGG